MPEALPLRLDVVEALGAHGLAPRPGTSLARMREHINDLYLIEIRALRDRCRAGEFTVKELPQRVVALRQRYLLLSLPLDRWTVAPG